MAESLINTKRRINTIQSTEKITKAMKLVASVKVQRWRRFYQDNLPYYQGMEDTLLCTLKSVDLKKPKKENPCLFEVKSPKTLYVVVTSTLGLCGAYNYNLFKFLDPLLKKGDSLLFVGQKGYIHYKELGYEMNTDYLELLNREYSFGKIKGLRHYLVRLYAKKEYGSVKLVYTHYKNSMIFLPQIKQLLPLDLKPFDLPSKEEKPLAYPPYFDPNPQEVLNRLLPHYLDALMYRLMTEAELSELASRRNAMETATDSADKIVSQLMITYNKTRQNAITQEITEVVAGANAGKKKE